MGLLKLFMRGRVRSDYQVTYPGGLSVRRVEYRRRVEWSVNGCPVSEGEARAIVRERQPGADIGF